MPKDALVVDRREFLIAGAAGLATAAGCSALDDDDGDDTEDEPSPVRVGYGGVPVEADLDPTSDDPEDPDSDTSTDDPDDEDDDSGGGYGGYGGGGGSEPDVTYVLVDGVLYGAPYEGQSAADIPYDDPEADPCLGYGKGPYGGVVEEGETPECREVDA